MSEPYQPYPPTPNPQASYPQTPPPLPPLRCPLCEGQQFQREESRQESRWGFTSHRMTLLICQRCRYVLHFYDTHSIFNLD